MSPDEVCDPDMSESFWADYGKRAPTQPDGAAEGQGGRRPVALLPSVPRLTTTSQPSSRTKPSALPKGKDRSWIGRALGIFAPFALITAALLAIPVDRERNTEPARITKNIEAIRVGERVLAKNPLGAEAPVSEIDPATWREIEVVQGQSRVILLRPLDWIDEEAAEVGETIDLDLPELGIEGEATVSAIRPCPAIQAGAGSMVTATYVHDAGQVFDLVIEGQASPIGATSQHPFWSEDRRQFVPVGELNVGERLRTLIDHCAANAIMSNSSGITEFGVANEGIQELVVLS